MATNEDILAAIGRLDGRINTIEDRLGVILDEKAQSSLGEFIEPGDNWGQAQRVPATTPDQVMEYRFHGLRADGTCGPWGDWLHAIWLEIGTMKTFTPKQFAAWRQHAFDGCFAEVVALEMLAGKIPIQAANKELPDLTRLRGLSLAAYLEAELNPGGNAGQGPGITPE